MAPSSAGTASLCTASLCPYVNRNLACRSRDLDASRGRIFEEKLWLARLRVNLESAGLELGRTAYCQWLLILANRSTCNFVESLSSTLRAPVQIGRLHLPTHNLTSSSTTTRSAMASPASLGSKALRTSSRHISVPSLQRRGLAAAASGSFQYETGDASGVKFASRDLPCPTTTLTVVAKAGTRYQPLPGYSDALEKFAFKVCQSYVPSASHG